MLNFIAFILLFFLVAIVAGAVAVNVIVRKWLNRLRETMGGNAAGKASRSRQAGQRHAGRDNRRDAYSQGGRQTDGITITDTRDQATAARRIFADNEGEYVDYEEI